MKGYRTTGRCYRRKMAVLKENRLRRIIEYGGYNPYPGYVDHEFVDGRWQPTGKYIKYMHNNHLRVYFKKQTAKRMRRHPCITGKGNYYRRVFDFWWELY